jgi:hypothetical protein
MQAKRPLNAPGRRLAAVLILVASAAVLLVNVDPAAAGRRCAIEHRACASFKSAGNTFDVCDPAYDGAAAAVQRGDRRIIAVNYWGSMKHNGCRRWHVSGRNGRVFKWRVCPAYHAKPGGKRISLSIHYCSGWEADIY